MSFNIHMFAIFAIIIVFVILFIDGLGHNKRMKKLNNQLSAQVEISEIRRKLIQLLAANVKIEQLDKVFGVYQNSIDKMWFDDKNGWDTYFHGVCLNIDDLDKFLKNIERGL